MRNRASASMTTTPAVPVRVAAHEGLENGAGDQGARALQRVAGRDTQISTNAGNSAAICSAEGIPSCSPRNPSEDSASVPRPQQSGSDDDIDDNAPRDIPRGNGDQR